MTEKEELRIGLVTPYTGGNLGDGAIQDAVIENLKVFLPGASFCLFTLDPQTTTALHGIPSLPVAAELALCYSDAPKQATGNASPGSLAPSTLFRSRLKSHPALRRLLRPPWLLAKGAVAIPRYVAREIRHVVMMYFILRRFKLLIVSGGGQIDDYWGGPMGHPYALLKWGLLARATGVKFVFLSVGVGSLDSKLSSLFARKALELADYRSYRDVGSKRLLAGMKFTHADRVIPDLAFSYPNPVTVDVASKGCNAALRIGISPMIYLYKDHWPKADATIFGRYLENLACFIARLLRNGHEVVLFESDLPDREATKLLISRLARESAVEGSTKLRVAQVCRVPELLAELTSLDCVVASRLHGVILSHLCIKPVLAISYERKVKQHMNEMEQETFCLDIHSIRAEELDKAFAMLSSCLDASTATIKAKIQEYRKKLISQYYDLARGIHRHTHDSISFVENSGLDGFDEPQSISGAICEAHYIETSLSPKLPKSR